MHDSRDAKPNLKNQLHPTINLSSQFYFINVDVGATKLVKRNSLVYLCLRKLYQHCSALDRHRDIEELLKFSLSLPPELAGYLVSRFVILMYDINNTYDEGNGFTVAFEPPFKTFLLAPFGHGLRITDWERSMRLSLEDMIKVITLQLDVFSNPSSGGGARRKLDQSDRHYVYVMNIYHKVARWIVEYAELLEITPSAELTKFAKNPRPDPNSVNGRKCREVNKWIEYVCHKGEAK